MAAANPVAIFADFTCPFCYVTEVALERLAESRALELRPHSFELYPAPEPLPHPNHSPADIEAVMPLAAELGLDLHPPEIRPRTHKAHEASHLAASRGLGPAMRSAIYRAYWSDAADIGRIDVLMELAGRIGIESTDLKIGLDIDLQREAVLRDRELARRLRVVSVPTLFIGSGPGARILQGARTLSALDEALAGG